MYRKNSDNLKWGPELYQKKPEPVHKHSNYCFW